MKFEKIKAGDVLYDAHRCRMGNTTARTMGVWPVKVLTVDHDKRTAVVSWNGNRPEVWFESELRKLRAAEPVLVKVGWAQRLATRAELKAMKDKAGGTP